MAGPASTKTATVGPEIAETVLIGLASPAIGAVVETNAEMGPLP